MDLFIYLLKVSACSALFFAVYLLVLRKLTFFKINRFYLLLSVMISFIIPTLQFTIEREVAQPDIITQPVASQAMALDGSGFQKPVFSGSGKSDYKIEPFDWFELLPYLYGAVVVVLLGLATWRLFQLLKHTNVPVKEINGLKLVVKEVGFTNCSFFNYVFIDENGLSETELAVLLAHEEVHVKQYHSLDKVLLMIAKAFLWFNPVIYLYDKALEQTHEYEADETTSKNVGTETYASLLLQLAVSKGSNPLIHNFVKSPIKKRIKMLFNSKSTNMKKLAYLLALPIGLGLIWGFTIDVVHVFPNQEREFTLVIDAGHGGKQKGSVINGVSEKEITLAMSKKLKAIAEKRGLKVITTRTDDSDLSLKDRIKVNGSFLISLHVNAEPKTGVLNGIEMYTSKSSDKIKMTQSIGMINNLYQSLKDMGGMAVANKPKQQRLYILENSTMPAVLLELGYLTNKKDFQFITDAQKQNELANAIIDGVLSYKKNSKTDGEMKAVIGDSKQMGTKIRQYVSDNPVVKRNEVLSADKGATLNHPAKLTEVKDTAVKAKEVNDLSTLIYSADSIKKNNNLLYLYGKAQVSVNNITYQGSNIIYDNKQNTLRVTNASIYDRKSNTTVTADSIHFDIKSSRGLFFGKVLSR